MVVFPVLADHPAATAGYQTVLEYMHDRSKVAIACFNFISIEGQMKE
jgi:hypothetical protein